MSKILKDPFLDDLIRKFVIRANTSRTIDSILIGLSSTVFAIRDFLSDFPFETEKQLFKEFLEQPEVRKNLVLLACNQADTFRIIENDPRFKNLRPHIDAIMETLRQIPCIEPKKKPKKPLEPREPNKYNEYPEGTIIIYPVMRPTRKKALTLTSTEKKVKKRPKKKLAVVLLILVLFGIVFFYPVNPTPLQAVLQKLSSFWEIDLNELKQYALTILNNERQKYGVPPLQLYDPDPNPAQLHAEELVKYNYISHWNKEGLKPNTRWAKYGYIWFGVSESISILRYYEGKASWSTQSLKDAINESIMNMIYHDEESNWGHRDDLLDPIHNKVAIGIAWDEDSFAIVLDCINDHIKWTRKPVIVNNRLVMEGSISVRFMPTSFPYLYVYVFKDETPKPLRDPEIQRPHSWSYGELVAGILPQNSQYRYADIETIYAEFIIMRQGNDIRFHISLDLAKIRRFGTGVFGIYIMVQDNLYKHPYRNNYVDPVTNILIRITPKSIELFK